MPIALGVRVCILGAHGMAQDTNHNDSKRTA